MYKLLVLDFMLLVLNMPIPCSKEPIPTVFLQLIVLGHGRSLHRALQPVEQEQGLELG